MKKILFLWAVLSLLPAVVFSESEDELTLFQKYELYEKQKHEATIPIVLNIFIGFGVGSFSQYDNAGGGIGLVADMLGIGLLATGTARVVSDVYEGKDPEPLDTILFAGGAITYLGSRIFQVIRPIRYTKKKNRQLRERLGLPEDQD